MIQQHKSAASNTKKRSRTVFHQEKLCAVVDRPEVDFARSCSPIDFQQYLHARYYVASICYSGITLLASKTRSKLDASKF